MHLHRPSLILATAAALATSPSWAATDYGVVLSSTPVVTPVSVTTRECSALAEAPAARRSEPSGAGAVVGALFGAALGSAFGKGSGRVAAAGVGMMAGAALGHQAEAQEAERQQSAAPARCRDITRQEHRTVGYDVVYEYQGVRRSVRLAQPPGDRIPLDIQVVPAGQVLSSNADPMMGAAPSALVSGRPAYRSPADNAVYDDSPRGPSAPAVPAQPVPAQASAGSDVLPLLVIGGLSAWAIVNAAGHHHHRPGPARIYRHR